MMAVDATIAVGWILTRPSLVGHRLERWLFCLRGSFGLRRGCFSLAGHELAHHYGLAGELAFHRAAALHADGAGLPVEYVDLDAKLVSGHDGTAELGAFDASEDHQLAVAVGDLGKQQSAAGLGDRFDDQDARHD